MIILSRFWPLLKQASFFEAAGTVSKYAQAYNGTTIVKFGLPQLVKHTIDIIKISF